MRYVEITHVYVIPIAAEDVDVIEPLAREGMSIMEGFMMARAANIQGLHSDWKLMPKEFQLTPTSSNELSFTPAKVPTREEFGEMANREYDRVTSLRIIEADADQGISFAGDVMGQGPPKVTHPWDQKLRIFPPDSEPGVLETEALRQEGLLCAYQPDISRVCVSVRGHEGDHNLVSTLDVIGAPREEIEP